MINSPISSGLEFLDSTTGGLLPRRCYLLRGPSQSGRTTAALQFLLAGIASKENGMLVISERSDEMLRIAESVGMPLQDHIDEGRLVMMEYPQEIISGKFHYSSVIQLLSEIERHLGHYSGKRLVFDTMIPLLTYPKDALLANYIKFLISSIEALQVTTLMTIGEPNSAIAERIIKLIEDTASGSFAIARNGIQTGGRRRFILNKMGSLFDPPPAYHIRFKFGSGLIEESLNDTKKDEEQTQSVQIRTKGDLK